MLLTCILGVSAGAHAGEVFYPDVQACTNAYNEFWFNYENIKSDMRNAPPATEAAALLAALSRVVDPAFHFGLFNLPVPPDFNTTIDFSVDGIDNLANLGASIGNFGEHHIAGPFSVKSIASPRGSRAYMMSTRDASFTRDATVEGGCTVYLAQKDVLCTVQNRRRIGDSPKALLNSIVDKVVTSYRIAAPQCGL